MFLTTSFMEIPLKRVDVCKRAVCITILPKEFPPISSCINEHTHAHGYLDSIIRSMLNRSSQQVIMAPARTGMSVNVVPWYATDAGVERRANEKSYHKLSTETFIQFKHRVLAYEQVSPEQYNETLRTMRSA